ncbi:aldose epimerase family protein [Enterococcus thailandicus]|uniref:aldose epimerase family protein n=1 Tax=Enterococcus TaxID=1350 RepID=UPI0032E41482
MQIKEQEFGNDSHLITLINDQKTELAVTDFGARIVHLQTLIDGTKRELILGFDHAEEYLSKDAYIGATIGRAAGRIAKGKFYLDNQEYQAKGSEETGHCLHGGDPSFEKKNWPYTIIKGENEASVIFYLTSPNQENGFPGNLDVEARYTLTNDDVWRISIRGISDQLTLFNPTNHVYFNLTGDVTEPIDQHELWLASQFFAPLQKDLIPKGKVAPVKGTAFDFTTPKVLSDVFISDFPQAKMVGGMDHPFFLQKTGQMNQVAKLTSPDKKVAIQVATNVGSIVLFTANFGDDAPVMRGDKLVNHGGITFETQEAPGSERFESFGDITLLPNQAREFVTEYQIKK